MPHPKKHRVMEAMKFHSDLETLDIMGSGGFPRINAFHMSIVMQFTFAHIHIHLNNMQHDQHLLNVLCKLAHL